MTPKHLINLWRCTADNTPNGGYADGLRDCANQLERCLNAPQMVWHDSKTLPTPGDHALSLMLENGEVIKGYRREYVASRDLPDLGYTNEMGQAIKPVAWAYA